MLRPRLGTGRLPLVQLFVGNYWPSRAGQLRRRKYLDAFVQYRTGLNLPCTAMDLGAMEGIGYLSENQGFLRKIQGTGWRVVRKSSSSKLWT
ncbi:hypothetical protein N7447_007580 [Penicillium robsamsonii]|uniref:uncharacterized protein n=1 Tax=Penicillium robsamsonii TaxID=1792511 RepID=UPI0025486A2D|nr:uncharacterized protein N7447_007580 [Penicillium robsamsonii]KAJ5817572.1 hypothetical protein N7447_007580 [Penicillium robsamsonii]